MSCHNQNQYFGVKAAQTNVRTKQGGVLWHTQGSGKSLIMVWLTKWIRENVRDSRVLIITDRQELDDQIQKLFTGVDENIYRTKSGRDLINVLNHKTEMLVCSLVHKFGRNAEDGDYDTFIEELKVIKNSTLYKKHHLIIIHREKKTEDDLEKVLNIVFTRNYGRSKIIFGTF